MKKLLFCVALLLISLTSYSQTGGCMDPHASNYNSSATENDGSCIYSSSDYTLHTQTNLSDVVSESSGLIQFDNQFWTFNDSGGLNAIYQINPAIGEIMRVVTISNATNTDWEAMAQNDDYLFIGDFGNNANGARQDLKIYKISKNDIRNSGNNIVTAEVIAYTYPDQTSFIPVVANATNFDAEAMVFANDSLHIFSKDWNDLKTRHYAVSAKAGSYQARLVETFDVDMLVTDASISPETKNIVLLGYRDMGAGSYSGFCWLLFDYRNNTFFSGNKRLINLGSALVIGQTEGISLQSDNKGYITSEKIEKTVFGIPFIIPSKLQTFDFSSYFYKIPVSTSIQDYKEQPILSAYPNPCKNSFTITLKPEIEEALYSIRNSIGQTVLKGNLFGGNNPVSISSLDKGVYLFSLEGYTGQTIKLYKQ